MVPRPTSPTALLWAHQLRREHGHLLERMKAAEEAKTQFDSKLKTVNENGHDISILKDELRTLVTQLNAVEKENEQINQRLADFESEAEKTANDHDFDIQEHRQRLEHIESAYATFKDELASISTTHFNLTKRVDRLEEQWHKTAEREKSFSRKSDPPDARALTRRIESLESKRSEDALQLKELQDKLHGLEKESKSLAAAYNNLEPAPHTGTAQRYERVERNKPLQTPNVPSSGRSEQLPGSPLSGKGYRRMNEPFLSARPVDLRTTLDQHIANASGCTRTEPKRIQSAFKPSQPRRSARIVGKQTEAANPGNSFAVIRKGSLSSAQARASTKRKTGSPPPQGSDVSKRPKTGKSATTQKSPQIVYERLTSRHATISDSTHCVNGVQVNSQGRQVMTGSVDIFKKRDRPGQKEERRVIMLNPLPPLEEL